MQSTTVRSNPLIWLVAALFLTFGSDQASALTIDFEVDGGGAPLVAGQIIDNEFAALGISVTTNDPVSHPAMIFDSANPTGDDPDLGSPNETFAGPGIGTGGESGQPGANSVALGNVLMISEDGDSSDPDDNANGGTIIFTFDDPTEMVDIDILDIDNNEAAGIISAFNSVDALILQAAMQPVGDNGFQTVSFSAPDTSRLEIFFPSSGAVASITTTTSTTIPEPGTWALFGLGGLMLALRLRRRSS